MRRERAEEVMENEGKEAAKASSVLGDTPPSQHLSSFSCLVLKRCLCLSYVRLITGFVFPGFIQPLCPCGYESLSANPPAAAAFPSLISTH
ncbi:hypothetical protein CgunFtcFv8_005201 [Champsocephalus gunnari]|uniref:Uncharacterized protein n=1 Tax=Champsocephalus gunnari TaxID=52237 RepID=A0AAN8HD80_CHAGU|nr:hypothetical protein CgunFtcFv8_005201 [Champsocephalus gunnari]